MSLVQFILMITAAIGFADATASRLADVMSKVTGYKTQLHSNVTAYDICMYLATGYQYNQMGTDKNIITTEAYDDHDQGVAKIITRYVNDEYDNTTEALDSYNMTQRVVNFDVADCDKVTDDEVISWHFSRTAEGTYYDEDLELDRRGSMNNVCSDQGQNCRASDGGLDVTMCGIHRTGPGSSCGCAEYGSNAAACQTARHDTKRWYTDHHQNWGEITGVQLAYIDKRAHISKRMIRFILTGGEYAF